MDCIDLRSDTVTVPTPEMRTAMANAVVGDDVYGEDPTVKVLQDFAASLLKKDGALFVPSGTFGNQCSILTSTSRCQELVISNLAHILSSECGAVGIISGVVVRAIDVSDSNGLLTAQKVKDAIRDDNSIVSSSTGLIAIEQPTLQGKVYPLETLKEIYEVAKKNGVMVHMDGARIFNAASYLKCQPWEIAQYCDTLMLCLSKGLCAPVGSLIVGSSVFIQRATKMRKLLGGGLRQVGVLAAPGMLAIQEQTKYLEKDHQMAVLLAEKLSTIPQIKVVDSSIQINMIHVQFNQTVDFNDLKQHMLTKQIKLGGLSKGVCRIMTHFYVRESQVDAIYEAFKVYLETKVNKDQ